MLVAVLSDVHANATALRAVLDDADAAGAAEVWSCGDVTGYGTQAADAVALLRAADAVCVMGNHDAWTTGLLEPPAGAIGNMARRHAGELAQDALDWLTVQPLVRTWPEGPWAIVMAHGTPDNPLDGRYYPDNAEKYGWLPGPGEIVVLGQTHYPILRGTASEGMLLNPGSVGQPRDGDPDPSWALLDLDTGTAELRRTRAR